MPKNKQQINFKSNNKTTSKITKQQKNHKKKTSLNPASGALFLKTNKSASTSNSSANLQMTNQKLRDMLVNKVIKTEYPVVMVRGKKQTDETAAPIKVIYGNSGKSNQGVTNLSKVVKIPYADIHAELKQHENYIRNNIQLNDKDKTNFLLIDFVFVISKSPWQADHQHGRTYLRVPLKLETDNSYKDYFDYREYVKFQQKIEDPFANELLSDDIDHLYIKAIRESIEKINKLFKNITGSNKTTDLKAEKNNGKWKFNKGGIAKIAHSERVAYLLLDNDEFIDSLCDVIHHHVQDEKGYKLYAVMPFVHSSRDICDNCAKILLYIQNSYQAGFLKKLADNLSQRGFILPSSKKIKSLISVGINTNHERKILTKDDQVDAIEIKQPLDVRTLGGKKYNEIILSGYFGSTTKQTPLKPAKPVTYYTDLAKFQKDGAMTQRTLFTSGTINKKDAQKYKTFFRDNAERFKDGGTLYVLDDPNEIQKMMEKIKQDRKKNNRAKLRRVISSQEQEALHDAINEQELAKLNAKLVHYVLSPETEDSLKKIKELLAKGADPNTVPDKSFWKEIKTFPQSRIFFNEVLWCLSKLKILLNENNDNWAKIMPLIIKISKYQPGIITLPFDTIHHRLDGYNILKSYAKELATPSADKLNRYRYEYNENEKRLQRLLIGDKTPETICEVQALVDQGYSFYPEFNIWQTLLYLACLNNKYRTAELLLIHGAKANNIPFGEMKYKYRTGHEPCIFAACGTGNFKLISLLFDYKVKVFDDTHYHSPFEYLCSTSDLGSDFHYSLTEKQRIDALKCIYENVVCIEDRNEGWFSSHLLKLAINSQLFKVAEFLIDNVQAIVKSYKVYLDNVEFKNYLEDHKRDDIINKFKALKPKDAEDVMVDDESASDSDELFDSYSSSESEDEEMNNSPTL